MPIPLPMGPKPLGPDIPPLENRWMTSDRCRVVVSVINRLWPLYLAGLSLQVVCAGPEAAPLPKLVLMLSNGILGEQAGKELGQELRGWCRS